MVNFVTGLDKPALLVSALFLLIYLFRKNKSAFILVIQTMLLSNWFLFIPDSISTVLVFDCLCVIVAGFTLTLIKNNFILKWSQWYLLIMYTAVYIVDGIYYYKQTSFLYNTSMFIYEHQGFIFWPHFVGCVIGLLYKGKDDGGRHFIDNDRAFRDSRSLRSIYNDGYESPLGYYERRY